jgi:hypothetical protein
MQENLKQKKNNCPERRKEPNEKKLAVLNAGRPSNGEKQTVLNSG